MATKPKKTTSGPLSTVMIMSEYQGMSFHIYKNSYLLQIRQQLKVHLYKLISGPGAQLFQTNTIQILTFIS